MLSKNEFGKKSNISVMPSPENIFAVWKDENKFMVSRVIAFKVIMQDFRNIYDDIEDKRGIEEGIDVVLYPIISGYDNNLSADSSYHIEFIGSNAECQEAIEILKTELENKKEVKK